MPGGERDDGLSPVCHPTPRPPPVAPSFTDKKDQRHFRHKSEWWRGWIVVGLCIKMRQICYCCDDRYAKTCSATFVLFFWKRSQYELLCCFDNMKLTISLPSWLSSTMKDHRAVFLLPSAHPHTNINTQTEKHCTLYNFGVLSILWPAKRGSNMGRCLGLSDFWRLNNCSQAMQIS